MLMKINILTLTEFERNSLRQGFRLGESHCFRMRCRAVLLKSEGLSSVQVGEQTGMTAPSVNGWVKRSSPRVSKVCIPVLGKVASHAIQCVA
ncbi:MULTISPECIES: hypothetical protein [unclassified Dysgonomonas]|uniref:hypothetical protein n=1 Tax=unclassified Dysgonomonas TaxID=2630389 RepID=UPI0024741F93|nr:MULTISPECIES: hypothetical protein [unclassified Dysgonomonas]